MNTYTKDMTELEKKCFAFAIGQYFSGNDLDVLDILENANDDDNASDLEFPEHCELCEIAEYYFAGNLLSDIKILASHLYGEVKEWHSAGLFNI